MCLGYALELAFHKSVSIGGKSRKTWSQAGKVRALEGIFKQSRGRGRAHQSQRGETHTHTLTVSPSFTVYFNRSLQGEGRRAGLDQERRCKVAKQHAGQPLHRVHRGVPDKRACGKRRPAEQRRWRRPVARCQVRQPLVDATECQRRTEVDPNKQRVRCDLPICLYSSQLCSCQEFENGRHRLCGQGDLPI